MTKAEIINKASRAFHKVGFKFKKHSPEILIVAGTVGVVASAVMACKASTKLERVLNETKEKAEAIKEAPTKPELAGKYTEEDSKKDLARVYCQTGGTLVKMYGPAVLLGVASLGCIITSHSIIRKRNLALAAAYATVDKGFKEYRKNVIERFGKELDTELKYNIKKQEVEEIVVKEDGTEEKVTRNVEVMDPNLYSHYARFYDDGCTGWQKDPEHNLFFLRQQQNFANDLLKAQGYLYLNDVYKMLGIPTTKAGQIVGWIYDEAHPVGDNFVDFGIFDPRNAEARRFVNGKETVILLDFNVDGNILDLMY